MTEINSSKCSTCNLSPELLELVHKWNRDEGLGARNISKRLERDYSTKIGKSAIGNHLTWHKAPSEKAKGRIWFMSTRPKGTDHAKNDVWFDESNDNAPMRWDGNDWVSASDTKPAAEDAPQTLLGVGTPVKAPKGWEANFSFNEDTGVGEVTSTPQTSDKITDFSQILEQFDIDPEAFEVDGGARISKWQMWNKNLTDEYGERVGGLIWLTAYKFRIRKKNPNQIELPTLYREIRSEIQFKKSAPRVLDNNRTLVVPFSDLQAGKVGSRGDSKALVERVIEKMYKLEEYALDQGCSEAVFLDGGDVVESFENVAQQGFTNDLSIMDQLDLAGTLEQEFISMLAKHHKKVTVAGVPSNHGAWRKGKDILGRPSDDWGLFLLKQIQKAYKLAPEAYEHVEFLYPEEWRKSINIDVQGVGVGLVHGEDSSLAQMENWWAKQVHGASPIAESEILITAHYHTFGLKTTGRSLKTGKQKWWVSTPTLDNGSDWWANRGGSDSDPGLLAFVVDKEIGFDLQSFTVL